MRLSSILLVVPNLGWINEGLLNRILQWMPRYDIEFVSLPNIKPIAKARNVAVEYFLKGKRNYFFMVDADVIPPTDAIDRLLNIDADVGTIPSFVMRGNNKITNVYKRFIGTEYLPITKGTPDSFGFGCVMIKREVLLKLKKPYFYNTPERVCEDIMFCEDVRKRGFKLGCDYNRFCENLEEMKI